jgi:hypothetical protein
VKKQGELWDSGNLDFFRFSYFFYPFVYYCCAAGPVASTSGCVVAVVGIATAAVPEASGTAEGCFAVLRLLGVVWAVVVEGNRFALVLLFGFAMTRTGPTPWAIVVLIPVIALTSVGTEVLAAALSSKNGAGASEIVVSS